MALPSRFEFQIVWDKSQFAFFQQNTCNHVSCISEFSFSFTSVKLAETQWQLLSVADLSCWFWDTKTGVNQRSPDATATCDALSVLPQVSAVGSPNQGPTRSSSRCYSRTFNIWCPVCLSSHLLIRVSGFLTGSELQTIFAKCASENENTQKQKKKFGVVRNIVEKITQQEHNWFSSHSYTIHPVTKTQIRSMVLLQK